METRVPKTHFENIMDTKDPHLNWGNFDKKSLKQQLRLKRFVEKIILTSDIRRVDNNFEITSKFITNDLYFDAVKKFSEDSLDVKRLQAIAREGGNNFNRYIFSADLYNDLKSIDSSKIKLCHLPNDFHGLIILPKKCFGSLTIGNQVYFSFEKLTDKNNKNILYFSMSIEGADTSPILGCDIDDDPNVFVFENIEKKLSKARQNFGSDDHIKIVLNLLVYINSGHPDLREFKNKIRYKSSQSKKPVLADKNLSSSQFIFVGYSYKKDRIYSKDSWYVPPYWSIRWTGPGRTLSKVVLVSDSLRKRKIENSTRSIGQLNPAKT